VDLELPPDLWDELTDLSVTVYDSSGQQLRGGQSAGELRVGRMSITLSDSVIGIPLTVELYPAFARLPGHAWKGTVRIRFLGPTSPLVRAAPYPSSPAGRSMVAAAQPAITRLAGGFSTLIETR